MLIEFIKKLFGIGKTESTSHPLDGATRRAQEAAAPYKVESPTLNEKAKTEQAPPPAPVKKKPAKPAPVAVAAAPAPAPAKKTPAKPATKVEDKAPKKAPVKKKTK